MIFLTPGEEDSNDTSVDINQRQVAGSQSMSPHGLAWGLPFLLRTPRQPGLENACNGIEQGETEDNIKSLSREKDLMQKVWRAISVTF